MRITFYSTAITPTLIHKVVENQTNSFFTRVENQTNYIAWKWARVSETGGISRIQIHYINFLAQGIWIDAVFLFFLQNIKVREQ